MDIFPSIANPLADAFVILDNVRVEDLTAAPTQPPRFDSATMLPNGQF